MFQTAAYRVDQATTIGDGPINHVGMPGDIVAMVAVSGGSLRLHERFDAGATLAAIERDRVNMIMTGATQLQRIVDHPDFGPTDLTSLQVVAWGGAALPLSAIRRLRARGLSLITTYGSSEATSSVSYADFDAPDDVLAETVGRPDARARRAAAACRRRLGRARRGGRGVPAPSDADGRLPRRSRRDR